ncbi:hypothetical protein BT67DRAFT_200981 [Trichocladium antarcticum]|uniref:Secreted protein n=1 Tax=Trichocladium antarcticum TaxID=1450529 RepID=A0AAN6UQM0_9PEZI|nr:hypothetical protein BT67DRAFT_200981 [Trichocladium antarcticum]
MCVCVCVCVSASLRLVRELGCVGSGCAEAPSTIARKDTRRMRSGSKSRNPVLGCRFDSPGGIASDDGTDNEWTMGNGSGRVVFEVATARGFAGFSNVGLGRQGLEGAIQQIPHANCWQGTGTGSDG